MFGKTLAQSARPLDLHEKYIRSPNHVNVIPFRALIEQGPRFIYPGEQDYCSCCGSIFLGRNRLCSNFRPSCTDYWKTRAGCSSRVDL